VKRGVLLIAMLVACLAPAHAGAADWHSEQPVSAGLGVPTPLGQVGDIQCWQANRCVLISAGNAANPAGLYAYDGTGWHLYSEVCGGTEGRIAWAGPDDFWTISDQRPGQAIADAPSGPSPQRSLCHFENGKVVASYAEPIGVPTSYLPMDAAACASPSDCWFGGERLPGTINVGAFHLHWDGSSLSAVPSLLQPQPTLLDPGRDVTSLAYFGGRYYESVQPQEDDTAVAGEVGSRPALVHRVTTGSFQAVPAPLEYPEGVAPSEVEGLRFGGDAESLWAAAGAIGGAAMPISVLRLQGGAFAPLPLQDPGSILAVGDRVTSLAPEPGSGSAWLGFSESPEEDSPAAALVRIGPAGEVSEPTLLPVATEGLAHKGTAGPMVCPAPGQCWMVTSKGWLFHLGGSLPQDTDPAMHVLITSRPSDNGQPSLPPDELPEDNSGSELPPELPAPLPLEKPRRRKPAIALVSGVKQKVIDGDTLLLKFTLHARAHVQLLAKKGKKVVAKTKRYKMKKGRHQLKLRLDPKHWPNHLAFEVHPLRSPPAPKGKASSAAGAEGSRFLAAITAPSLTTMAAAGETGTSVPADFSQPATVAATPAVASVSAGGSPIAETVLGTPGVNFIGTSSGEAVGEVWGITRSDLYRFTEAGGWEAQVPPQSVAGSRPGYEMILPGAGRTTAAGGVAVLANLDSGPGLVVRDPGTPPRIAEAPGVTIIGEGESLFRAGSVGTPEPLAAFESVAGGTGAFLAPAVSSTTPLTAILRYDPNGWAREPICLSEAKEPCVAPAETGFEAVALAATGETNAWLLARGPKAGILLFHRVEGEWVEQPLEGPLGSLFAAAEVEVGTVKATVAPRRVGAPLTVTTAGVWVDAELGVEGVDSQATFYFDAQPGSLREGQVEASWCDLGAPLCTFPLESELSAAAGTSFAWPPDGGSADPYGTRVITGVGQGAMTSLNGVTFTHLPLLGGSAGATGGAALQSPTEGWLGAERKPVRLTPTPHPSGLLTWPLAFRHPLTAIVAQPGAPVGAISSQALAVGAEGEVARYVPGEGWHPEALLNGSGSRVSPTLRGVAWPTPNVAYAVGDEGEMWLWREATGLWESDPGKPPNLIRGNFTGIAFDPSEPERGYAVGQQGLLLAYGKQWTQEALPSSISAEANITSISFAGSEAIAAFSYPVSKEALAGGVLVNDGSGWKVDEAAEAALAGAIPTLVSGLPDGGAAVATRSGILLERQGAGQPWQVSSVTANGIAALAAIREGGAVRAVAIAEEAIGTSSSSASGLSCPNARVPECEQIEDQTGPGQPPILIKPFPLYHGYTSLLRQNGFGWTDEQHQSYPAETGMTTGAYDLPDTPDPLAALLLNPEGNQGWAVGGRTGEEAEKSPIKTATVARYPADVAAPNQGTAQIPPVSEGQTAVAIGGNDQCAEPCADSLHAGIGPDIWLPHAITAATQVGGVGAFVYTGPGVAEGAAAELSPVAFSREEGAYGERLTSPSGFPVYAAAAETDLDRTGTAATFTATMEARGHVPPGTGHAYYSFISGANAALRVIVLDYSHPELGAEQDCWLAQELERSGGEGRPAIVVGNRSLVAIEGVTQAADAAAVTPIVVNGEAPAGCVAVGPPDGASAYFFDFPEENRTFQLTTTSRSIPVYGSGTLGYTHAAASNETDFVGASGFLVAAVDTAHRDPVTNIAPVSVRLIPNVSELALNALDGTLLHRSRPALFEALARRPQGGMRCLAEVGVCGQLAPDPYIPIPNRCQGARCASGVFPEYRFTSSHPGVADFVAADPRSLNPRSVLLQNGKPVPDPTSALLCAYNAGETTVTVETGGLSYSMNLVVQSGSVQQPCGTVPVENPPVRETKLEIPPFEASEPPPPNFNHTSPPLHAPSPPQPHHKPSPTPHHVETTPVVTPVLPHPAPHPTLKPPPKQPEFPFFYQAPEIAQVVPIIPPVTPPAAQPTPPSGTSPVTQPAVSPEPEEEEEAAFDLVHHATALPLRRARATGAAYAFAPRSDHGSWVVYGLPALVLLAALSTCGIVRRRRPDASEPALLESRR
jgi:hypothetical protein